MQTRKESLFENIANVMSGLLLSAFVVQPLVFPVFGVHLATAQNVTIAVIFTIVSIARGYIWRRYFNRRTMRRLAHLFEQRTCATCHFYSDNRCRSLESNRSSMRVNASDTCKQHQLHGAVRVTPYQKPGMRGEDHGTF
jgi:hypothetical protein